MDYSRPLLRAGACVVLLLAALAPVPGQAHDVGQSYLYLTFLDDVVEVRVELLAKDVNLILGNTLPEDGTITAEALVTVRDPLEAYLRERVVLLPDGQPWPMRFDELKTLDIIMGQFVTTQFVLEGLPAAPEFIDIRYNALFAEDPDHTTLLVIENDWRTRTFDNEADYVLTFTAGNTEQRLDLSTRSHLTGFLGMIRMGVHHIWIGVDHILFLLALLLPAAMIRRGGHWEAVPTLRGALMNVVRIVTVFTVAHSVTLIAAALGFASLPSRLVESIIAASIAIAAIDLLVPVFRGWLLAVIALFGLFHGFGFATVLGELRIPENRIWLPLLGFNIGVELGQLAIVAVVVPVLYVLRHSAAYRRYALPAGALLLIAVASYWFIERAFEIDLPAGALLQQVLGVKF